MNKETKKGYKEHTPVYVMVPRKLIGAWIASFIVMMIMTGLSMQWAYYINERSNKRFCGIIHLFNDASKEQPPVSSSFGQELAKEFVVLGNTFHCD